MMPSSSTLARWARPARRVGGAWALALVALLLTSVGCPARAPVTSQGPLEGPCADPADPWQRAQRWASQAATLAPAAQREQVAAWPAAHVVRVWLGADGAWRALIAPDPEATSGLALGLTMSAQPPFTVLAVEPMSPTTLWPALNP